MLVFLVNWLKVHWNVRSGFPNGQIKLLLLSRSRARSRPATPLVSSAPFSRGNTYIAVKRKRCNDLFHNSNLFYLKIDVHVNYSENEKSVNYSENEKSFFKCLNVYCEGGPRQARVDLSEVESIIGAQELANEASTSISSGFARGRDFNPRPSLYGCASASNIGRCFRHET